MRPAAAPGARDLGYTGRQIVVFRHGAVADGVKQVTAASGLKARVIGIGAAANPAQGEVVVFERLGAAIVAGGVAGPGRVAGLALGGAGGAVRAVLRERVVRALPNWYRRATAAVGQPRPSGDYLRGFSDGVDAALDAPSTGGAAVAAELAFDETDATWGLQATGVVKSGLSGAGVRLAVLDTGLDLNHPDFAGRVPAAQRRNLIDPQADVQDGNGHGTHCCGVAAGPRRPAAGPRYGAAHGCELYVGKVLDDQGSGVDGDILAGLEWALANDCRIASLSLGGSPDQAFDSGFELLAQNALDAGLLIVAAAGNESDRPNRVEPVAHPANTPSIACVGALDVDLAPAWFSNAGLVVDGGQIDIAAPGVGVHSSYPLPQQYASLDGTSMATPLVAGIAALFLEQSPDLSSREVWSRLVQTARRLPSSSQDVGAGIVQAPG